MGAEPQIVITGLSVEPARITAGTRVRLRVTAGGGPNYAVRQTLGGTGPLPGWLVHDAGYAFLPGKDFTSGPDLKSPEHFHRDNGARDRDPAPGSWAVDLDTTGWPAGTHEFTLLACNRPQKGPYVGQERRFAIVVDDGTPLRADEGDLAGLTLSVNGVPLQGRAPEAPIRPGQPNRLSVDRAAGSGDRGSLRLELRRDLADPAAGPDPLALQEARLGDGVRSLEFDLGVFAVPARFEHDAGALYRRTTRFTLSVHGDDGRLRARVALSQAGGAGNAGDVLSAGVAERVYHLGRKDPAQAHPLDPPVLLRLDAALLRDPDAAVAVVSRRGDLTDLSREGVPGRLLFTAADGNVLLAEAMTATVEEKHVPLPVADLPPGDYRVSFAPQIGGSADSCGPSVRYRRRLPDPARIGISPLAPWMLDRDLTRPEILVADFAKAAADGWLEVPTDAGWHLAPSEKGFALIHPEGRWDVRPATLRLPSAAGWYALFAETAKGWTTLQVGDGLVRGVREGPTFVEAAEMTGKPVRIYGADRPGSGLRSLRLVPVMAASVQAFRQATGAPPRELRGVADWCDYVAPPPVHHSGGGRIARDQFGLLVAGHGELGMRSIAWSIGRSWVEYHSELPETSRFPCAPLENLEPELRRTYEGRAAMIDRWDALNEALAAGLKHGVAVLPWLGMQRHYGTSYGGIFASKWFMSHPEWWRVSKNGDVSTSTVSYHFAAVRNERCRIFAEVARRGVDAVVVGCCRQVPMLLYHPAMVTEFQTEFGYDPRTIDAADTERYRRWIGWRADRFTEFLRQLRRDLAPLRSARGKPIAIVARIPSVGLFYNLAQGLDLETWLAEGLVDELQVEPLEDCNGQAGDHSLRPYLDLARARGVPVLGGVNGNTWWNLVAILQRALGLLEADVRGIEVYESNNFAVSSERRWLIPLMGHPEALRRWLDESNLDAVYPVWSRNAASGFDNHSFGGRWSVYGSGPNAL